MRYADRVTLVRSESAKYDASSGNFTEPVTKKEVAPANVHQEDLETVKALFGEVRQGVIHVVLPCTALGRFDSLEYDGKSYKVAQTSYGRRHVALTAEEVRHE